MELKKIIITAGGTSEKIDNVRKITNSSSGKLGKKIAEEFLQTHPNTEIIYICSKNAVRPMEQKNLRILEITDVNSLEKMVTSVLTEETIDCFIHSMAVSDYTVDYVTNIQLLAEEINNHPNQEMETTIKENTNILVGNKLSSHEDNLVIVLKPTKKIISLIKGLNPHIYLVGFKLLDGVSKEELITVATMLKEKNKCNLVVANDLSYIRKNDHTAFLIDQNNQVIEVHGKEEIAKQLVKKIDYDCL